MDLQQGERTGNVSFSLCSLILVSLVRPFLLYIQAGGGIGGGGILVPIYCLVMGFSPKHAIPLSNITVFGGSVANTLLNARKRHPLADRPLVDWDLILVMEPLSKKEKRKGEVDCRRIAKRRAHD